MSNSLKESTYLRAAGKAEEPRGDPQATDSEEGADPAGGRSWRTERETHFGSYEAQKSTLIIM